LATAAAEGEAPGLRRTRRTRGSGRGATDLLDNARRSCGRICRRCREGKTAPSRTRWWRRDSSWSSWSNGLREAEADVLAVPRRKRRCGNDREGCGAVSGGLSMQRRSPCSDCALQIGAEPFPPSMVRGGEEEAGCGGSRGQAHGRAGRRPGRPPGGGGSGCWSGSGTCCARNAEAADWREDAGESLLRLEEGAGRGPRQLE